MTVIGGEAGMPYDRPPLSKKYLSGEVDAERIALRKPEMIDALGITPRELEVLHLIAEGLSTREIGPNAS